MKRFLRWLFRRELRHYHAHIDELSMALSRCITRQFELEAEVARLKAQGSAP